jgi:ribA/ribD-fused uncharacterized protein
MSLKIDSFSGKYRFLSNFYMHPVNFEGILYPSSEHAYQAAKTLSQEERKMIASLPTPALAKKDGKKLTIRNDWEEVKYNIMKEIVSEKFKDNDLKNKLNETSEYELIEGNTWGDTIWGVCNGEGTNWLGKILMEIRDNNKFRLGWTIYETVGFTPTQDFYYVDNTEKKY